MNRVVAVALGGHPRRRRVRRVRPTPSLAEGPAGVALEIRLVARDIAFAPARSERRPGCRSTSSSTTRTTGSRTTSRSWAPTGRPSSAATEIVPGPATVELDVPGLVPGVYQLLCEVHPNMVTSLTVGG